ncbi:hypothetical protein BIW11_04033 [Tropilaelaps mercedesae]|uniref:Uncharacterized protein n=1 Tax=Tropilaelaps mercedesae TaxID=418985 RepID=A0A1V9XCM7_9ACAR|nr:hypothetical protein BIW11_04033 [Tropilaelaps mercedesae]
MATCVQRVGNSSDMTEIRDEVDYMTNLLQKNPATGPVMFEMEIIYSDTVQALMAIPSVVRKPISELSLDDLYTLRDATFNLMVLPIRIERLRSSLATMLLNTELYSRELAVEITRHLAAQFTIAARMGSDVLRCRSAELAAIAQATISTSTWAHPATEQEYSTPALGL